MFKAFKKLGSNIQDASKAVGKGIQSSANKTGAAFKKGSPRKHRHSSKGRESESESKTKRESVVSEEVASVGPPMSRTTTPGNQSHHSSRPQTPERTETIPVDVPAEAEIPTPAPAAEEVNLSLSNTEMPAPQEEEQINLDISDSTSSIQFDTASPEKTETAMVEEKEEMPAVEEKPEKAEKTKKPTRSAKEKERKTERQKTAEKVTKEAEKPKERKKQKSREEKPKPAAKADSRKSTPQERPLSIASSRSGRQEKRSISPHSEKPVRYSSSASEDSRASRHHSRTPSEVSIEPRKSAKKRHGQAIPGGEPSSFDLYSKRKTRRAKASPRRRRPSPREEDQLDYLELLQQCREDARYLYNRRSNQRSPSYGRSETKRYTANREASRHSTPRRSPRGFRERELVEEPVLRSPYTQGNYNWRERDVYDPIEGYEEEYVPSDREYYRPTRRSRSADRTGRVDELNDSYYQAQAQRLRSPRSERRLSNHSSRVASPNAHHRSLSVEQRFRSPQHSGRQTPSVASEVSETDLLDEVEWKLDALAQEILVEDTILEERMRSSPFERLYHMNNRRDRDERRKKLVQYTSLEKIRQKLLDGSVEREIEEREHKKRQQEALLQDPSGVYLRLYNNSYAASRAANRSGDGHVSPLTSPRRPSRRNSALSNGSANRRPTPKRSSSYIKELSTRLYKGGAVLQNQQRERQEQTAAEREEQEIEDFLVARLMARIERERMVKGRILSYEELEATAREQVRQQMKQDLAGTQKDLIRGPRLSLEDQEKMSKRLALHGYVSAKKLQEKKEEKELEHCTFSPQINPYSEQLASNELERYIDKTIRPVPEGLLERSEDTTEDSHPAHVDRCEMLYNKALQKEKMANSVAMQHEEEMKHRILQSKLENDHHFRRRVELDPRLAQRFMNSLVV